MEESLYKIVCRGIITLCMLALTLSSIYVGCELEKANQLNEKIIEYYELRQQYDTTSTYNKMVLYPRLTALADTIKH